MTGELPGLRELLAEDLAAHKGERRSAGYKAMRAYRLHVWTRKHAKRPFRKILRWAVKRHQARITTRYGIEIPVTANIGRRIEFAHQHGIVIHGKATIGDDCLIRHGVSIGAGADGDSAPTLGDRVSVSPGAVLIGNIKIGDDVHIGPNAVVSTNVAAGMTVFAQPPRAFKIPRAKTEK